MDLEEFRRRARKGIFASPPELKPPIGWQLCMDDPAVGDTCDRCDEKPLFSKAGREHIWWSCKDHTMEVEAIIEDQDARTPIAGGMCDVVGCREPACHYGAVWQRCAAHAIGKAP